MGNVINQDTKLINLFIKLLKKYYEKWHVNESNVPICCNCYYILIPVLNTGKVCSMKYAIL